MTKVTRHRQYPFYKKRTVFKIKPHFAHDPKRIKSRYGGSSSFTRLFFLCFNYSFRACRKSAVGEVFRKTVTAASVVLAFNIAAWALVGVGTIPAFLLIRHVCVSSFFMLCISLYTWIRTESTLLQNAPYCKGDPSHFFSVPILAAGNI